MEEERKYLVDWEENLFSIYCDLLGTAREWMLSGAGIHLDDIMDCIDVIEYAGDIADEERIRAYPIIRQNYEKVKDAVSGVGECYRSYMSKERMDWNSIKEMMDDVRELTGIMQRGIGKMQHTAEEIGDIRERMEFRNIIKGLTDVRKVIKHFNDSFSLLKEIEWNAGYSKTHIHIIPKSGSAYHPLKSKLMDIEIRGDTEIDISVSDTSITAEVSGGLFIGFFAFGKIPDMYAERITIDRNNGVEIVGGGRRVNVELEYGEAKISVTE